MKYKSVPISVSSGWHQNICYYVFDPRRREGYLVDPAWEPEKIERVVRKTQTKVCGILLTHSHFDHTNLAEILSIRFECPIYLSSEEYHHSNFRSDNLVLFDEGFDFGLGVAARSFLTPGHTPGSTCFLFGNSLFTGDVLFAEGCGFCSSESAANKMYQSLKSLKSELSPSTRIYPGHIYGRAVGQTLEFLMGNNIYLQFDEATAFVNFRMRQLKKRALI